MSPKDGVTTPPPPKPSASTASIKTEADIHGTRRSPGVVPGASHELPFEKPGLVHRLILEFLTDQQVDKMIHPVDEP